MHAAAVNTYGASIHPAEVETETSDSCLGYMLWKV
jgi:hypothetical protein